MPIVNAYLIDINRKRGSQNQAVTITREDFDAMITALRKANLGINSLITMMNIAKPEKLDESLCWRHNNDLAHSRAEDALIAIDAALARLAAS